MRMVPILIALVWGQALGAQGVCAPRALPPVNACTGTAHVSLALVGDVLVHQALAWRGYQRGFASIWGAAIPLLSAADLTIANLEGPVAPGLTVGGRRVADPGPVYDGVVYTEYPAFNYHPVLIAELRAAGVDIVTTANNHTMDRGAAGVEATLAALDAAGLRHSGAHRAREPFAALRVQTALGPLALIACTFGTNGLADPHHQVPLCYDDRAALLALIAREGAQGAAVIVLPHWGQEYTLDPDAAQRRLARELVAAGAIAVVGTHPHVPQPWEVLQGPAGLVPVIHSTGNFIAAQPPLERATSLMAWLDLCRGGTGIVVGGAGYVPLQMEFDGADPSLTLPRPGMGQRAEAGRALLARLIPGRDLSSMTDCRAPRAARPPAPPQLPQDR